MGVFTHTNMLNDKIIPFLQNKGCTINEFSDKLEMDCAGRCYYLTATIELNCITAREAVFTLLHEGGHWLSYLRYYKQQGKKQPSVRQREIYAYLYGWYIIRQLNLPISKKEWREENIIEDEYSETEGFNS